MDFFFYGTLRDDEVRRRVLGRELPAGQVEPAEMAGFDAVFVADASYPTLVARPGGRVEGLLARRLGSAEAGRLARFEGAGYCTRAVTVIGRASGPTAARVFVIRAGGRATARPWRLEDWQRRFKPAFLATFPFRPR